jgi:hypothetical protein
MRALIRIQKLVTINLNFLQDHNLLLARRRENKIAESLVF